MRHNKLSYRPEIDGLRAIAVLPVILFHAGIGIFSGGFVGVDVFFVISGYLITSIIINEKQQGNFSFAKFYERRIRRILPALFLVMFVCLPFAWAWMLPEEFKSFSRSLASISFIRSNVTFAKESGYFDMAAELKPLLHTWSLSIEEQYYLIFPALLMLLWKFARRWIVAIFAVIAIASLGLSQWESINEPQKAFYLMPARGWELLIGAIAAFYLFNKKASTNFLAAQLFSILGITLILYPVFMFNSSTVFPGFNALIPALGTVFVILFASSQTLVGKILSIKPLVGIGLISYSAYLWHQPLLAFTRIKGVESPSLQLLMALITLSLILAFFSWKYVETPFRKGKFLPGRRNLFAVALAVTLFFFGVGSLGRYHHGFKDYYFEHRLDAEEQKIYMQIQEHTGGRSPLSEGDNNDCNFRTEDITEEFINRFKSCSKKYGSAVILLGDSHATNIHDALVKNKIERFFVSIAKPGCRPHDFKPNCHYKDFEKLLLNNKNAVKLVIFHQSGSYLLPDYLGRVDSPNTFAEGRKYSIAYDSIDEVSDYLGKLSEHTKIVWLGPFVEARFDFRNIRKAKLEGFYIKERTISIFDNLDSSLQTYLAKYQNEFSYVSLVDILKVNSEFLKQGDCITYRDQDHFSLCGEIIIGKKMKEAFGRSFQNLN